MFKDFIVTRHEMSCMETKMETKKKIFVIKFNFYSKE